MQDAIQDRNQFPALIGHSGTAGTAEIRRVVVEDGAIRINTQGSDSFRYDTTELTYQATTDTIVYYTGGTAGTALGTVVITYTDSGKGTVSLVERTPYG